MPIHLYRNLHSTMQGSRLSVMVVFLAVFAAVLSAFSSHANALSSKDKFFIGENCYQVLKKEPSKQKYRDQWMLCIDKYQDVFRHDPKDPWAPAGLYMSGVLFHELFKRSGLSSDQKEAVDTFERIIKRYPSSKYKDRAFESLKHIIHDENKISAAENDKKTDTEKKIAGSKKSLKYKTLNGQVAGEKPWESKDPVGELIKVSEIEAEKAPQKISGSSETVVSGLRYWSNPNYTRVVIDADEDTQFEDHLLKPDPKLNTPRRLYVDLANARLGKNMERLVPINDDLLKDARAGQFTPETVRVVVDIKTFSKYKIFPLKNPFRIVIDVWGSSDSSATPLANAAVIAEKKNEKLAPGSLARQLALGVSRIVIDPGHGGKDYGAPGYIKGVHEKYIVLELAKKLSFMIQKELGCQVYLTRSDDRYLTLEERTAFANTKDADLFISLHTNASTNRDAFGIETYFLNLATDEESIRVAAMENATSRKNISDLQTILNDLMQNAKINESARLAAFVQSSMSQHLNKNYNMIKDKGVKQAPFYVLLGAQMPAVLVETSFISHPRECKRLMDPKYQDHICRSILDGIRQYIKHTNPTAILTASPAFKP
ncbi:MAG: N-acetylmuramoyl-L-alanine amidase [Desulfobacterales bacterium]